MLSLLCLLSLSLCIGLALVYFLNQSSDYSLFWYNGDELVKLFIIIDLFVSTVPFALSVMYHTFMPHTFGVRLYTLLLKIDIFGVWFVTTFGALCSFYVTLYCLPTLHIVCLSVYVPLSLVVLYYMVVNDCKMKRVIALTIQFLFRFFILLIRLTPLITVPLIAFQYYLIMNVISSIGALINVLRIPERWFPGRCDYILNGHSLMHIAAVLSLAVGRCGTLADLTWLTSKPICVPSEI